MSSVQCKFYDIAFFFLFFSWDHVQCCTSGVTTTQTSSHVDITFGHFGKCSPCCPFPILFWFNQGHFLQSSEYKENRKNNNLSFTFRLYANDSWTKLFWDHVVTKQNNKRSAGIQILEEATIYLCIFPMEKV